MNKFLSTAAAAILALTLATTPAQAKHEIGHFFAGVVAGAIIGGALAQHQRGGVYYGAPVYGGPVYAPQRIIVLQPQRCYMRQGVVLDLWGQPRPAWIRECF